MPSAVRWCRRNRPVRLVETRPAARSTARCSLTLLTGTSHRAGNIDVAYNPNGAVRNIAGIKNAQGNVFGMMPHPERASSAALSNIDGRKVFDIYTWPPEIRPEIKKALLREPF